MCGIIGTIGYIPDRDIRKHALESLHARGPDASGEWSSADGPVWFGHRRLSIISLGDSGNQPMAHPDRSDLTIIYNGEIYNFHSLKAELERAGCRFHTESDTELILHAYTMWGEALVDRIEGMFAFAIFDRQKPQVLFARDPVGQKPLYFRRTDRQLSFASTPDALRILDRSINKLSANALCYIATIGYIPSPLSIWRDIEVLPPGHRAIWSFARPFRIERYWAPPDRLDGGDANPAEFGELFSRICAEHTISDVPIGLFLSSGLDSTSIARALADANISLQAYTFGVRDDDRSEVDIAKETARFLGFPIAVRHLELDAVDMLRSKVALAATEPIASTALITMYAIAEQAAREVKTVLSGDGGDELFGGYPWYRPQHFNLGRWLRVFAEGSASEDPTRVSTFGSFERFSKKSILHSHAMRRFRAFLPGDVRSLFASLEPDFCEEAMLSTLQEHYVPELPWQSAMQRIDLMTYCSGRVLVKVDRMSMANSLEVRSPFLDRRLIDWALSRWCGPARRGRTKDVLRHFLSGRVPGSVLAAPKKGFGLGGRNFAGLGRLEDEIAASRLVSDGMLSKDFRKYTAPDAPYRSRRLWLLAAISKWYEYRFADAVTA